jgi:sugar phosphate isomerase/epimerase
VKIALYTDVLSHRPLDEVLEWLRLDVPEVDEIELGTGGYSSAPHCPLRDVLSNASRRRSWIDAIAAHGFRLAALNVSGNPLHPDPAIARAHDADLRDTIRLAAELGVDRVVAMSGCPGAGPTDRTAPHFSGGGWLPDLERIAEWQWQERVLPYWAEVASFARDEFPDLRICLELHPGTFVYNTSTFLRIAEVGQVIAVNLDPSHFFWQSIDPLAVIRALGAKIGYVHGKDTRLNTAQLALNGVLDNRWPDPSEEMPWTFATVGRGHDSAWWSAFLQALTEAGFDGTIGIEHEDPFVKPEPGIVESVRLLASHLPPRTSETARLAQPPAG